MRNRKFKVLALMVLVCGSVWGQTQVPENSDSPINYINSNVGIANSSPKNSLEISNGFSFHSGGHKVIGLGYSVSNHSMINGHIGEIRWDPVNGKFSFSSSTSPLSIGQVSSLHQRFCIDKLGNVGIGTSSPNNRLHIENGDLRITNDLQGGGDGKASIIFSEIVNNTAAHARITYHGDDVGGDQNYLGFGIGENVGKDFNLMVIKRSGSVGIGTTNPGSYKLAVEGIIGAHEIKVTTDGWADFVFDENYALPQLQQVEEYIQENKHLPNIPSEQEVLKEGIALGEMDAKLLQKIEELTLYTISQEKKLDQKDKEVQELKEARRQMEERLQKLEALLLNDK